MKWEILKGSAKDFEGAPDWATECVWNDKGEGSFSYWLNPETKTIFNTNWHNGPACWNEEYGHRNYIRAERRPITEPVVNQQLTTEWSGEGLPHVGCVCEFQSALGSWAAIRITAHGEDSMLMKQIGKDNEQYISKDNKFRPIRSPEDVAKDKAFSELEELEKAMPDGYQPYELLDAIVLAGYRKVE